MPASLPTAAARLILQGAQAARNLLGSRQIQSLEVVPSPVHTAHHVENPMGGSELRDETTNSDQHSIGGGLRHLLTKAPNAHGDELRMHTRPGGRMAAYVGRDLLGSHSAGGPRLTILTGRQVPRCGADVDADRIEQVGRCWSPAASRSRPPTTAMASHPRTSPAVRPVLRQRQLTRVGWAGALDRAHPGRRARRLGPLRARPARWGPVRAAASRARASALRGRAPGAEPARLLSVSRRLPDPRAAIAGHVVGFVVGLLNTVRAMVHPDLTARGSGALPARGSVQREGRWSVNSLTC